MRTTVNIDEQLIVEAQRITGVSATAAMLAYLFRVVTATDEEVPFFY